MEKQAAWEYRTQKQHRQNYPQKEKVKQLMTWKFITLAKEKGVPRCAR